ncbi:unnamed protein product [marine sediment metagenome]|uniref:Ribbon-helix-helix protein CopG domain-containing protein n=1 Tax=marine sediment metagenome TaxID=412755 RepID=X1FSS4_9ZZZZ
MKDSATTDGKRKRPQLTMTVHPDTINRLNLLCDRFRQSRGQVVDRLVLLLDKQYSDNKVYCMTGEPCRWNRVDVPDIF